MSYQSKRQRKKSKLAIRPIFGVKLPFMGQYSAITLYPFIFLEFPKEESDKPFNQRILVHELIHIRQVRLLGWLRFYLTYCLWYFKRLVQYRNHMQAYFTIPHEIQAFKWAKRRSLTERQKQELGI